MTAPEIDSRSPGALNMMPLRPGMTVDETTLPDDIQSILGPKQLLDLLAAGVAFDRILDDSTGRGIRVPEDVFLVGFDDEPVAAFMIPPLTTVRQPAVALGTEAARIVLARLKGEQASVAELKAELIVRESTAFHR